jgi:cell division septal protein FtsQ
VFSYYTSSHKQLNKTQRIDRLKVTTVGRNQYVLFVKAHWFAITTITILVISGVYSLTLSFDSTVTIEGTKYRPISEYQTAIQKELSTNPLNLAKPTLQRKNIEKKLKEQLPEVRQVTVSAPLLGRRPNVTIVMDEPAAVMKQQGSTDLIVSERGRLLLAASQSKATTNLPVITNQSGVTGKAGEQFLRPDDMSSLSSLFEQVKLAGSSATYILPTQTREVVMVEPSRGVYQVRFLFGDTLLQQYGALRAAQKKIQELGQTPSEYIDARLATKVFYK